jgi:endonuclease/exonuclease/phosphatase family metal-dependent hydrolase
LKKHNKSNPQIIKRYTPPKTIIPWLKELPSIQNTKNNAFLRLATWNIQSFNKRLDHLKCIIEHYNIDIIGLTEIQGNQNISIDDYTWINKIHDRKYGIGFLIHNSLMCDSIEIFRNSCPNTMYLRIMGDSEKKPSTLIGLIYAKSGYLSRNNSEKQWNQISSDIQKLRKNSGVILLGDFNARVGRPRNHIERQHIGSYGEKCKRTPKDHLFIEMLKNNQLMLLNNRKPCPTPQYTFHSALGRSIIDYIMVSKEIFRKEYFVHILPVKITGTEAHSLLYSDIKIYRNERKTCSFENIERINIGLLKNPTVFLKYKARLEFDLKRISTNEPEEHAKQLTSTIQKVAKQTLGTLKAKTFINSNFKIEKIRRKIQRAGKRKNFRKLPYLKNRLEKEITKHKNKKRKNSVNVINSTRDPKTLYKAVKQLYEISNKNTGIDVLTDETGSKIYNQIDILNHCTKYCKTLSSSESDFQKLKKIYIKRRNDHHVLCSTDITLQEVTSAFKKLKFGKSPGADMISSELLKINSNILINTLHKSILLNWKQGRCPLSWNSGLITLLHKKDSRENLDNYRQITVQNQTRQILCRIIDARLKQICSLSDSQNGFRAGRRPTDNIKIIHDFIRYGSRSSKIVSYIIFFDFSKAFDSMSLSTLIRKLYKKGVSGRILTTIIHMYLNAKSKVKHKGKYGATFTIQKGVAQGCVLSPELFAIYTDDLLTKLNNVELSDSEKENLILNCLAYADDLVLMAKTIETAKKLISIVIKWCEENEISINISKSGIMPICSKNNIQNAPIIIKIRDQTLPVVDKYKYIGALVRVPTSVRQTLWKEHAENVLSSLNKTMGNFRKILNENNISPQTKLNVLDSLIISKVNYGNDVIVYNKCDYMKLEKTQNKILRKSLLLPHWGNVAAMKFLTHTHTLQSKSISAQQNYVKYVESVNRARSVRKNYITYRQKYPTTITAMAFSTPEEFKQNKNERFYRDTINCLLSKNSHTKDIFETCRPFESHILLQEIPNKYNRNMIKWLTGNTDLYSDIKHLNNLYKNVTSKCRLCGYDNETRAHVLESCPNTHYFVQYYESILLQNDSVLWNHRKTAKWKFLLSIASPLDITEIDTNIDIRLINTRLDLLRLEQRNTDSNYQIYISSKTKYDFTICKTTYYLGRRHIHTNTSKHIGSEKESVETCILVALREITKERMEEIAKIEFVLKNKIISLPEYIIMKAPIKFQKMNSLNRKALTYIQTISRTRDIPIRFSLVCENIVEPTNNLILDTDEKKLLILQKNDMHNLKLCHQNHISEEHNYKVLLKHTQVILFEISDQFAKRELL